MTSCRSGTFKIKHKVYKKIYYDRLLENLNCVLFALINIYRYGILNICNYHMNTTMNYNFIMLQR